MDNIVEEWRPVVGWEGLYEVSNYGRVRSLDRNYIGPRNSKRVSKGKILNGEKVSSTGYIRVMLQNGKKRIERISVHRLVAFAFPEICGEYKGQGDASRKTGISQTLISRCIRGKMRQTNGYKWKIKQEP